MVIENINQKSGWSRVKKGGSFVRLQNALLIVFVVVFTIIFVQNGLTATVEGYAFKSGETDNSGITINLESTISTPTLGITGLIIIVMGFSLFLFRTRNRVGTIPGILCCLFGIGIITYAAVIDTTMTDFSGAYNFPDVTPGDYSLSFSAEGYQPENIAWVSIGIGTNIMNDIVLDPVPTVTPTEIPTDTPTPAPTSTPASDIYVTAFDNRVHFNYGPATANEFEVNFVSIVAEGNTPSYLDFDVTGSSGTGTWTVDDQTMTQFNPNEWFCSVTYSTSGEITGDSWLDFGIKLQVDDYATIFDYTGVWLLDGVPLSPGHTAVTGFWFDAGGYIRPGYQTLRIVNDTDLSIDFEDFEFAVSDEEIPLEDLSTSGLGVPGASSPGYPSLSWQSDTNLPSTLPVDAYYDVHLEDIGLSVQPDDFLLVRGQQVSNGISPGAWGYFWEQTGAMDAKMIPVFVK